MSYSIFGAFASISLFFFFCRFWDVFGFGIGEIKQNIAPFLEKGTKLLAVHDSCFGWGARGGVLLFFEVCWLGVCRRIYQNITSLDATSHELVFPRFSFKWRKMMQSITHGKRQFICNCVLPSRERVPAYPTFCEGRKIDSSTHKKNPEREGR